MTCRGTFVMSLSQDCALSLLFFHAGDYFKTALATSFITGNINCRNGKCHLSRNNDFLRRQPRPRSRSRSLMGRLAGSPATGPSPSPPPIPLTPLSDCCDFISSVPHCISFHAANQPRSFAFGGGERCGQRPARARYLPKLRQSDHVRVLSKYMVRQNAGWTKL